MSFKNTNLNDYQFKSSRYNWGSTYMSPMEITNQKCIIDTNQTKKIKHNTKDSHQSTREENKERNKKEL